MPGDIAVALLAGCGFLAFIAYEIAGLTIPGWHTVSYYAHRSWIVRFIVLMFFAALIPWWVHHAAQNISR